jgi:glycine/D-amino acid oxidase-like deaminating enzyme
MATNDRQSLWWGTRQSAGGRDSGPAGRRKGSGPASLPERADVVIASAGLTGLSTAVMLARAGRPPVVVEMDQAGSGTTGHSSAKVSLLPGSMLQRLRDHVEPDTLRAYVEANRAGQDWLREVMSAHGTKPEVRTAITDAATAEGVAAIERERVAARAAGLDFIERAEPKFPFEFSDAIGLVDQLQIDPVRAIEALVAEPAASAHPHRTQPRQPARLAHQTRLPEPWQVHLGEPIDDRPLDKATRTRGRRRHQGD